MRQIFRLCSESVRPRLDHLSTLAPVWGAPPTLCLSTLLGTTTCLGLVPHSSNTSLDKNGEETCQNPKRMRSNWAVSLGARDDIPLQVGGRKPLPDHHRAGDLSAVSRASLGQGGQSAWGPQAMALPPPPLCTGEDSSKLHQAGCEL